MSSYRVHGIDRSVILDMENDEEPGRFDIEDLKLGGSPWSIDIEELDDEGNIMRYGYLDWDYVSEDSIAIIGIEWYKQSTRI